MNNLLAQFDWLIDLMIEGTAVFFKTAFCRNIWDCKLDLKRNDEFSSV
jgi:hypothetical protein